MSEKVADLLEAFKKNPRSFTLMPQRPSDRHREIKDARREDDPRFSQGVWQTPLKKAEWPQVETLCVEALQADFADVQVIGWLIEAWSVQSGFQGFDDGLMLLDQLIKISASVDPDEILPLLEWLDTLLSGRLHQIPWSLENPNVTFAQWQVVTQLEAALTRAPDKEKAAIQAQLGRQKNTTALRAIIAQETHFSLLLKDCLEKLDDIERQFSFDFYKTRGVLEELLGLASTPTPAQSTAEPITSQKPTDPLAEIYEILAQQTHALESLEPQGVVHLFLKKLLAYRGCSQIKFFQQFTQNPEDLGPFLRFLGADKHQS